MGRTLSPCQLVERSINKKFRQELWTPFMKAIRSYGLLAPDDHVAVCMSADAESTVMAKLFQELIRHSIFPFRASFITIPDSLPPDAEALLIRNCEYLEIPLTIVRDAPGHSLLDRLTASARKLGCGKAALGNTFEDVNEKTLLHLFDEGRIAALPPIARAASDPDMFFIRPLYQIHRQDVGHFARYNHLSVPEAPALPGSRAARCAELQKLIQTLKQDSPDLDTSLFNSIHDVCLDTMVGFTFQGKSYTFEEALPGRKD